MWYNRLTSVTYGDSANERRSVNDIDKVFSTVQAAVSIRTPEHTAFDELVESWAWENLSDEERDAFFAAVGKGRYIDAHQILTSSGRCWPWRRPQFDRWLASHSR